MALIQRLISSNRYPYKSAYTMNPIGICIHNTDNDAPAKNEVSYMERNDNKVSFHVAIDDKEAIQCIPFNRTAFAAGDGSGDGNRKHIHIEICYSLSGGPKFEAAEKRAAKEVAALLKKYGWGISKIKRHKDFSNKNCPQRTMKMGWKRFLDMVSAELKGTSTQVESSTSVKYRVVVNSYTDKSYAEAMRTKLKVAGIDSFLDAFTKDNVLYYRVITDSFNVKENAEKRVAELKAKGFESFIAIYNMEIKVGSKVKVKSSATNYATGQSIPSFVKEKTYTVTQTSGSKSLLSDIVSWVKNDDLTLV